MCIVGATRRVARSQDATPLRSLRPTGPKPGSLAAIIGQLKSVTTRRANTLLDPPLSHLWQRNYYEHVIRNERSLQRLRDYIAANPSRWPEDQLHPDHPSRW